MTDDLATIRRRIDAMRANEPVSKVREIPKCPRCKGEKRAERLVRKLDGMLGTVTEQCELCEGYGFVKPESRSAAKVTVCPAFLRTGQDDKPEYRSVGYPDVEGRPPPPELCDVTEDECLNPLSKPTES